MAKKKQPKRWVYSPSKASTRLDAATKTQVESKVQALIEKELKPKHVKPPEDARFNYITDITLKWHGSTLFLVAVYACPGPNAISPSFSRCKPEWAGNAGV